APPDGSRSPPFPTTPSIRWSPGSPRTAGGAPIIGRSSFGAHCTGEDIWTCSGAGCWKRPRDHHHDRGRAYGILEKVGETARGGRRAYYQMPNREGVERALRELGALPAG